MKSNNPSIEASLDPISTANWSAWNSGHEGGRQSSLGSKFIWFYCRFVVSYEASVRRSLPRYIYASLMMVYYADVDVMPKENTGRERSVFLQLRCMLKRFAHFLGWASMQHQGLFPLSGWVLKAILCSCLWSCGVSRGGRTCRNMDVGFPLLTSCLKTGLNGPVRRSHGWCIF